MNKFCFDHVSELEFEEFCFDLLAALGAQRMSWRKGTGLNASPSDQGRDIECYFETEDALGEKGMDRWFVECKHYKAGVPPEKLQTALSWAQAEQPGSLLIICSNFLSNPAKTYLKNYESTNQPRFKIKIWERKDLERLTHSRPSLLRKYRMVEEFPFLKLLHPAHIHYLRRSPLNSLDYFFSVFESAGVAGFKEGAFWVYLCVLNYQDKEPHDPERQTVQDLLGGPVTYSAFREKCFALAPLISEGFLVRAIVNEIAWRLFYYGDSTDLERVISNNDAIVAELEDRLKQRPSDVALQRFLKETKERVTKLPRQTGESYQVYVNFCEKVLAALFTENLDLPQKIITRLEPYVAKYYDGDKEQRRKT